MPVIQTPRPHEFYLSLWTRTAEATLWGKSALRISDYADRCLWMFVHETARQDWSNRFGDGKPRKLHHYHALLRMPSFSFAFRGKSRLMMEEQRLGRRFRIGDRCARMQDALIAASRRTPEPYASSALDNLRGADIDVRPYRPEHTPYIFKQLHPRFREHWTELLPDALLRDHGLMILPHLPQDKQEKHTCETQSERPMHTSDSDAAQTSTNSLPMPRQPTSAASQAGFGRG
jgi:hypothetical protein